MDIKSKNTSKENIYEEEIIVSDKKIKNNKRNIISQEKIENKIKKNIEYNHLNQIDKKDNGIDYAKLKDANAKINSELYNLKRIEEEEKNIKNNLLNLIKSSGGNYGEI